MNMKKVVVADDNKFILEQLVNTLKQCEEIEIVGVAKDGMEELNYIKEYKPDVVVTDIEMPYMTGVEVIEIVKDFDEVPDFIVMTGGTSSDTIRKLNMLPIKNIFNKPIDPSRIIEEILSEQEVEENEKNEDLQQNKIIVIEDKSILAKIKNFLNKILQKYKNK